MIAYVPMQGFVIAILLTLFVGLLLIGIQVYMAYWTYKDAQRRGMDSPELWGIAVLFASLVGIILYLMVRE